VSLISLLLFAFRVFVPYYHTGRVDNMPTLVVTMILFSVAVTAFFAGAILNAIQSSNKRNFELNLINANEKIKKYSNE
jgi:hypothetical protein